jgi:hypothetical protein
MTFNVGNKSQYNLVYNWSDYTKSETASVSSMSKELATGTSNKQSFHWYVTSNNIIKKDATFTVDPIYGTIAAAVTDSEEWDESSGYVENPDAFVRLGDSNYFMTSGKGDSDDGFLTVIEVNDTGVFNDSVISEWEYDITYGYYAGILHISGDIYAVYYEDTSNGVIFTTRAYESNGTLQKTMIDKENYIKPGSSHLIHVTGDIYALTYEEYAGGYDHFLETYTITSSGAISARIDVIEYNQSSTTTMPAYAPHMALIDSNTIAIVYSWYSGGDGGLITYNISDAGDITNTYADFWEFDSTQGTYPGIKKVSGNVFAITFQGSDADGFVKTLTIADTGAITKSFIDFLEFDTTICIYPTPIFTVNEGSVYGVTYKGVDDDGFVKTFNMSTDGTIGAAIIDSLEFDTVDNIYYSPVQHIADNYYAICYTSTVYDGWACSVEIETDTSTPTPPANTNPANSNPNPANASTGVGKSLSGNYSNFNITISDADGNNMNITWGTNASGSWVTFNTTTNQGNGTYYATNVSWVDSFSTTYYWYVNTSDGHDGYDNDTYYFTTRASSWQSYNTSINGTFSNTTTWKTLNSTINGTYSNATTWKTFNNTINGTYSNTTTWFNINTTINGTYSNTTVWITFNNTINGTYSNTTTWITFNNTINGTYTNTTPNSNPSVEASYPLNGATGVPIDINRHNITISDPDGDLMNYTYRYFIEGCNLIGDNALAVGNGTYSLILNDGVCCPLTFNTTYTWWVNVSDGNGGWDNETFSFTTRDSEWKSFNSTINGTYSNSTDWVEINNTINGTYSNSTLWNTFNDTINGTYSNTTSWQLVYADVDININGTYTNTSDWLEINSTINGTYSNITSWVNLNDTINGTYSNVSSWQTINSTINGTYTNTTIFTPINDTINGTYSNSTLWTNFNSTINGTYSNVSSWQLINSTINGTYSNTSVWTNINSTINGTYSNTTLWHNINTTINGTYSNVSAWQNINNTINGTYTNTTIWHNFNNTINGTYSNVSITSWQDINTTINGTYSNTTLWHTINGTINGTYTNSSLITITLIYPANNSNVSLDPTIDYVVFGANVSSPYHFNVTILTNYSGSWVPVFNATNATTSDFYVHYNISTNDTVYWMLNVTLYNQVFNKSTGILYFLFNTTNFYIISRVYLLVVGLLVGGIVVYVIKRKKEEE